MLYGPIGCGETSLAMAFVRERLGVDLKENQTIHSMSRYCVQHTHALDFDYNDAATRTYLFGGQKPRL